MRKSAISLCLCLCLFGGGRMHAQSSDGAGRKGNEAVPGFIVGGLKAYKNSGPDAAIQTWLKGSPIEGNQDAQAQLDFLHQIQDSYGPYQSFEVISARDLGPRTRILYMVMEFEKGPLFAKFVVYRSEQGWLLANFTCNTHDEAIFPVQ